MQSFYFKSVIRFAGDRETLYNVVTRCKRNLSHTLADIHAWERKLESLNLCAIFILLKT